jgi:hypothetical protein
MKVFCKKEFNSEFIKGKYYEVYLETDDSYWLFGPNGKNIRNFKKDNYEKHDEFILKFSEYFFTNQELRKEKLNNLKHIKDD